MSFLKLCLDFFQTTKVWLIGLAISIITIHLVLCSIEIVNIREYTEDSLKKNAEEIEKAIDAFDIFTLRDVLRRIYDSRMSRIVFFTNIQFPALPAVEYGFLNTDSFSRKMNYNLSHNGLEIGSIEYSVDLSDMSLRLFKSNRLLYLVVLVIFFLSFFLTNLSIFLIVQKLDLAINLIADLKELDASLEGTSDLDGIYRNRLFSYKSIGIRRVFDRIKKLINSERAAAQNETIVELARQVSHDIRSPLTVLNFLVKDSADFDSKNRALVQSAVTRISDIANDLLQKSRQTLVGEFSNVKSAIESGGDCLAAEYLLIPTLEEIVTEKRINFREQKAVEIVSNFDQGIGVFVSFRASDLKRIISNLVNNAVEAFENNAGRVSLALINGDRFVDILVSDDGIGIPDHIVRQLGEKGKSFGKNGVESGSGLGIYYSKKRIEEEGGIFSIDSDVGRGTVVRLSLIKCSAPSWFCSQLSILPKLNIFIVDDDISIHHLWRERFKHLIPDDWQVQLYSFTSATEFQKVIVESRLLNRPLEVNSLYLIDFEFINQELDGMKLVDELGVSTQTYLVTSHYDETKLLNWSEGRKVKMIPKFMIESIPIVLESFGKAIEPDAKDGEPLKLESKDLVKTNFGEENPRQKFDLCLIDDDVDLIHVAWKHFAKERNFNILVCSSYEEFCSNAKELELRIPIFVDVDLGESILGTDIAEKVNRLGFTNISLATGYFPESIEVPPFIKRVVGKEFPDII